MSWRLMEPWDLDQVEALADTIHIAHPEERDVLVERHALYPEGCHVLAAGERLIGYVLSHPWRLGEPPPLNAKLGEIPRVPTTYYVHDVALLPEARGKGHAAGAVARMTAHAERAGFDNMSLVAVNKSQVFWEKLGFRTVALRGLEAKLISYGGDAALMVRNLPKARD